MKRGYRWRRTLERVRCHLPCAVLPVLAAVAQFAPTLRSAPVVVHQPLDLSVGPGDRAGFAVDATAATPASYQWYHDGAVVPGATTDLIIIEHANSLDAGAYRVNINDGTGETWSNPASLTVAPYTSTYVDPLFQPAHLDRIAITASALLADGHLVLAQNISWPNRSLIRLNPDGTRDASFQPAPLPQVVYAIVAADDGSLYIGGGDSTHPGLAAKLKPTGELDATFHPTPGFGAVVVVPQADRVVVNRDATLVRLNPDGSIDSSFVFVAPAEASGHPIVTGCAGAQGKIYVATANLVWRITANGAIDPAFAAFTAAGPIGSFAVVPSAGEVPHVAQLVAVPSGGVMVRTESATGSDWPPYSVAAIRRLTDSGAADPTFSRVVFGDASPRMTVLPDGRLLLGGAPSAVGANNGTRWNTGLALMNADGTIDANFLPVDLPRNDAGSVARESYPFVHVLPGGTQAIVGGTSIETWRRMNLQSVGAPSPPRILRVTPDHAALTAGDDLTLTVQVVGPGPLSLGGFYWQGTPGSSTITFQNPYPNDYSVTVFAYGLGGTDQREVPMTFTPAAPHFTTPTETMVTSVGRDVRLLAERRGTPWISLEWSHGQNVLVPADSYPLSYYNYLDLHHVSAADAGDYRVVARNALGQAERTIHLVVLPTSSIVNVSCRAQVEAGDRIAILGLTLEGPSTQRILARAIGSELFSFGIQNFIAQPSLRLLHDQSEIALDVATPDDEASVGAIRFYPTVSTSVEGTATLSPDTYTLMVSPQNGAPGIGLVEFFQVDRNATQVTSFSARTFVGTGEKVAQIGFVVDGVDPIRLLVRAIGPGLRNFGVGEPLADPVLRVVNIVDRTVVGANDDWETGADGSAVSDATTAVQAFPLGNGAKDAALIVSVPPGMYTAVVSGKNAANGIVLTQVYVLR